MTVFSPVPEIDVTELARKLATSEAFVVLDVREQWELRLASLRDSRLAVIPLSRLAAERTASLPPETLDPEAEILVLCHHGVRSADVTRWLRAQGWKNVYSVRGGIDAYAIQIDPSVGKY